MYDHLTGIVLTLSDVVCIVHASNASYLDLSGVVLELYTNFTKFVYKTITKVFPLTVAYEIVVV